MALINCPECGRENVSDRALACPNCGYPISYNSNYHILSILDDKKFKEDIIKNVPKLTKDGEVKKTPNNAKENRDNVQPIKAEDIPRFVKYYESRIDSAQRVNHEMAAKRDMVLFNMGINIALRFKDLITLKWSDIYNDDWTSKDGKATILKTAANKDKYVFLKFNDDFMKAIDYYKQYCDEIEDMDSYIFVGSVDGHISDAAIELSLKNAAKSIGIKYNINTYSLRKTYIYIQILKSENESKLLVRLQDEVGNELFANVLRCFA